MAIIQKTITERLQQEFEPSFLDVENQSPQHRVPDGAESHFKVTICSEVFKGKLPVARHQMIYALLKDLMDAPIHALSIHAFTPEQWQARGEQSATTPPCRGGRVDG